MPRKILPLRFDGITGDLLVTETPQDQWTSASNAIMREGYAQCAPGDSNGIYTGPTALNAPIHALYLPNPLTSTVVRYMVVFSDSSVYLQVTDGTTGWKDITPTNIPGGPSGPSSTSNEMTSGIINGLPFWNWPRDFPFYWGGNYATPTVATVLPGWPALTVCDSLRPYRDFLVAMAIYDTGGSRTGQLMWSDRGGGAIPPTWTALATNEAGDTFVGDSTGFLIDGKTLQDSFYVYKENSCYQMREIGLPTVMALRKVFDSIGCLARNCIQDVDGMQVVVTNGDVVQHDGRSARSLIDRRMRRFLFDNMIEADAALTYTVYDPWRKEYWICYSADAAKDYADQALVYNGKQWGVRDLDGTEGMPHITTGLLPSGVETKLFGCEPNAVAAADRLVTVNDGTFGGAGYLGTTELVREGIRFDGFNTARVGRVWPVGEGLAGSWTSELKGDLSIGVRKGLNDSYSWSAVTTYDGTRVTPATFNRAGHDFAFKFTGAAGAVFALAGFDVEVEEGARW